MRTLSTIFLMLLLITGLSQARPDPPSYDPIASVKMLEKSGGRVSWSVDGEWIALDQKDEAGYYDVYVMRADGSEKRCLTKTTPSVLPQKHNGSPEFHPSGQYLVFTAEKQSHRGGSKYSRPGQGVFSDIWVVSIDGKRFWKIVDLPQQS